MASNFFFLKVISSILWGLFGLLAASWYIYPGSRDTIQSLVITIWALLVLVILEEIYYMIEEKIIRPQDGRAAVKALKQEKKPGRVLEIKLEKVPDKPAQEKKKKGPGSWELQAIKGDLGTLKNTSTGEIIQEPGYAGFKLVKGKLEPLKGGS